MSFIRQSQEKLTLAQTAISRYKKALERQNLTNMMNSCSIPEIMLQVATKIALCNIFNQKLTVQILDQKEKCCHQASLILLFSVAGLSGTIVL